MHACAACMLHFALCKTNQLQMVSIGFKHSAYVSLPLRVPTASTSHLLAVLAGAVC